MNYREVVEKMDMRKKVNKRKDRLVSRIKVPIKIEQLAIQKMGRNYAR